MYKGDNTREQHNENKSDKHGTHHKPLREAQIEWENAVDELDLLVREANAKRFDVGAEVFDLAAANDGEAMGRFVHHVGDCD